LKKESTPEASVASGKQAISDPSYPKKKKKPEANNSQLISYDATTREGDDPNEGVLRLPQGAKGGEKKKEDAKKRFLKNLVQAGTWSRSETYKSG